MIFSLCFGLVLKKMETWKTKNTLLYEMDATGSGTKPSCCIQNHYICDSGWELCLCQLVQLFPRHGFQLPIAETNILSCKEKPKIRSSALQKDSYFLTWRTGSNWRIFKKILLNPGRTHSSGSELGWSPCSYSTGVMDAMQSPELELTLNPALSSLLIAQCISKGKMQKCRDVHTQNISRVPGTPFVSFRVLHFWL